MKTNISALILCKNEEGMIEDCLKQLDFAREIIILDQNSSDNTLKIAQKYTDKIYKTTSDDFAKNRRTLASKAKNDWLLYIDADERLSEKLVSEIKKTVAASSFSAYFMPRKNFILGKWAKHGGWWPDYVPRLFRKEKLIGWYGPVHESPKIEGEFGYFNEPLNHLTARDVSKMMEKSAKWAKVEARLAYQAKHPKVTILKTIKAVLSELFTRYVSSKGFLDGQLGLIEAMYQSYHRAMILVYLWEMQTDAAGKFRKIQEDKVNAK